MVDNGCKNELTRMIQGGLSAMRVSKNNFNLSTDVGPLSRDRCRQGEGAL